MEFFSLYDQGFARIAACTVPIAIADPATNAATVLATVRECHDEGVAVAVFSENTLSGYAIEDFYLQDPVLDAVHDGIRTLAEASAELTPVIVVGAPLHHRNRLYNTAVVIHRGRILGVAPKSYLPNYREFYDKRHFAPGDLVRDEITVAGQAVPFGADLLFEATDVPGLVVHAEICEDMWVPIPPSASAALAGATVLVNLSGSPITVTRAEDRKLLCRSASTRCTAAYVYAAAGEGESSTDLSWDGQTMIYELGDLLAETERFPSGPRRSVADIDLDALRQERQRQGSFDDNARSYADHIGEYRRIRFELNPPRTDLGLKRAIERFPFVPADDARLELDCYEAYNIQVHGLVQRLREIGNPKIVIGISGGLDSTHALLVAAQAMDRLGRPRTDILAYTMPGFATSDHTKGNALKLMEALGVSADTLDITSTARLMLENIDHPFSDGADVYDVTFENVQAGLRTDYLFRLANHKGGIVLGTGDLSELALGWCTYGVGDQMSHYAVNTGVPKTLMQHLIRWVISSGQFQGHVNEVLQSILDTEISPELVPVKAGEKPQSTQAKIGPYELQDFTLFYTLRRGYRPAKIAFLQWHAWHAIDEGLWPPAFPEAERNAYDLATIRSWMEVFIKRYFAFSQFKRSALPNGPKVLAGGSLSPRGDWRAPSDANARVWLAELERDVPATEAGV